MDIFPSTYQSSLYTLDTMLSTRPSGDKDNSSRNLLKRVLRSHAHLSSGSVPPSSPTTEMPSNRMGGGRGASAVTRPPPTTKPRTASSTADGAGSSGRPSTKSSQSSSSTKPSQSGSSTKPVLPTNKGAKMAGGGRRAVARPAKSNAEKIRAIEATEAALVASVGINPTATADQSTAKRTGGGRHPVVLSEEAKRARIRALEAKFTTSGGRTPRRVRRSSLHSLPSGRSMSSLSTYAVSPSEHDSLQRLGYDDPTSLNKSRLAVQPQHHDDDVLTRRARHRPSEMSLTSLSSFTAFVPASLARSNTVNARSPSLEGQSECIPLAPTYLIQMHPNQKPGTAQQITEQKAGAYTERGKPAGKIGDDTSQEFDENTAFSVAKTNTTSSAFSYPDDSAPTTNPAVVHYPVTVCVTTHSVHSPIPVHDSASYLLPSVDAVISVTPYGPWEGRDAKLDPHALFPRRRRVPFGSVPMPLERTAFAEYGEKTLSGNEKAAVIEKERVRGGGEIRVVEHIGWFGEWSVFGKPVDDLQVVIRELRDLR